MISDEDGGVSVFLGGGRLARRVIYNLKQDWIGLCVFLLQIFFSRKGNSGDKQKFCFVVEKRTVEFLFMQSPCIQHTYMVHVGWHLLLGEKRAPLFPFNCHTPSLCTVVPY